VLKALIKLLREQIRVYIQRSVKDKPGLCGRGSGAEWLDMNVKVMISLLVLVTVVSGAIPVYYDDLLRVFESWRSGEPKALIILDIRVPQVDADRCVLAVMRYPSMYLPNNGTLEKLFIGAVSPGSTVVVRKFIPAVPVKMRYDEARRSHVVDYYEPQEFLVMVHCVKSDTTVFKFGRNIEVYPRNVVHRETVNIAALAEKYGKKAPAQQGDTETNFTPATLTSSRAGALGTLYNDGAYDDGGGGGSSATFSCDIIVTNAGDCGGRYCYTEGVCYTYVAGPYLYSINGMSTTFGLEVTSAGTVRSAVYIESFYDMYECVLGTKDVPEWKSAGKKLVPTIINDYVPYLTGNSKIRIYFYVTYRYYYEEWWDTFAGVCYQWWVLYPLYIGGVERADQLGVGYAEPYTPLSPPLGYTYLSSASGSTKIYFLPATISDYPLVETSITFSYSFAYPPYAPWSITLSVSFYKAGRSDNQYGVPYVEVVAPDCFRYYYWFRDDDPMTYEVLFAPR